MRERPCTREVAATASSMERGDEAIKAWWSSPDCRIRSRGESTLSFVILDQPVPSRTLVRTRKCISAFNA